MTEFGLMLGGWSRLGGQGEEQSRGLAWEDQKVEGMGEEG